jgi:hypothetical protein
VSLSRLVCFRGPPSTLVSESRSNVANMSALKLKANLEKMIPETGIKENVATFKPKRTLEKSYMAKAGNFVCPLGLKNRHKLVLTVSWRRRSMLDKLDTVLLALDELVDGGVILEIEPSAIVNRVGMRGASPPPSFPIHHFSTPAFSSLSSCLARCWMPAQTPSSLIPSSVRFTPRLDPEYTAVCCIGKCLPRSYNVATTCLCDSMATRTEQRHLNLVLCISQCGRSRRRPAVYGRRRDGRRPAPSADTSTGPAEHQGHDGDHGEGVQGRGYLILSMARAFKAAGT